MIYKGTEPRRRGQTTSAHLLACWIAAKALYALLSKQCGHGQYPSAVCYNGLHRQNALLSCA